MNQSEQLSIYQQWVDQYKIMIFKVVRAYTFSELDENDLFQEISIQLWRSIPSFRKESRESTWIYRIALNTAIKWERDQRNHHTGKEVLDYSKHLLTQPETRIDDRLQWIYSELKKLNKVDRSICLLMLDGFSYTEISNILGITESNVGVKIYRIKKYLKKQSKNYPSNGN